jgi:hypothetical protein
LRAFAISAQIVRNRAAMPLTHEYSLETTMNNSLIALGLLVAAAAHSQSTHPPREEVGDEHSFGRSAIYLGMTVTAGVSLGGACKPPDPGSPDHRCIPLPAQPAFTSWNEDGLATLQLPAASTNSLICFAVTPLVSYEFRNLTSVPQPNAAFSATAVITIENEVLNDPTLIDPRTGRPYGGRMTLQLGTYSESRSIAVGEREHKSMTLSRHCIGGLVSKRSLVIASGLTEAQAEDFFEMPMRLTFGASGSAQMVTFGGYFYGIRLYGDLRDR